MPILPEPHYPDQGEFWLGWPVKSDTATKSAPAPAVQQPVAAASILSAALVAANLAVGVPAAERTEVPGDPATPVPGSSSADMPSDRPVLRHCT